MMSSLVARIQIWVVAGGICLELFVSLIIWNERLISLEHSYIKLKNVSGVKSVILMEFKYWDTLIVRTYKKIGV